jgi:hypothetical protein
MRTAALAFTALLGTGTLAHADVCYRLSDRFSVRAGAGLYGSGTAQDVEVGDVSYDMTIKVGGVNVFAEWYPFGGNFRVSGGLTTIRSPWTLAARSVSHYTINGRDYPAAEVGELEGELRFGNGLSPAILVGWGNPVRRGKHLGLVLDVGLAYIGEETLTLRADGPLASDPAFQRDLAAEQEFHSGSHAFAPVLRLGISYQF